MMPVRTSTSWSRQRFEWKKSVNRSQDLKRGSKQLASFICDEYVNKETGCCWPSNQTLAVGLGVTRRSIQRYLSDLTDGGWLTFPKVRGRRRMIQICFPPYVLCDSEDDNQQSPSVTQGSPKRDTVVVRYNNQLENQRKTTNAVPGYATVTVTEGERSSLFSWTNWIDANLETNSVDALKRVKTPGGYQLPCRFPDGSGKKDEQYRAYFLGAGTHQPTDIDRQ